MTTLPPHLASLTPELVLAFRNLLQATTPGGTQDRWEDAFDRALEQSPATALALIHSRLNTLYAYGGNGRVQGLVNAVEFEIARYWSETSRG